MKRGGIINAQLSGALARLGHTDMLVICDAGLPFPDGPEIVDLAFVLGTPGFETVLEGVLGEIVVERATAADEVAGGSPDIHRLLTGTFSKLDLVSHEELKQMSKVAKVAIRSGADTPYSNVILHCGVPF